MHGTQAKQRKCTRPRWAQRERKRTLRHTEEEGERESVFQRQPLTFVIVPFQICLCLFPCSQLLLLQRISEQILSICQPCSALHLIFLQVGFIEVVENSFKGVDLVLLLFGGCFCDWVH
ncbi:hypothetical protein GmHk_12G034468 [Glycine max]|nr:hypothetical protein GmHk_12G034468 [Glycine max]